MTYYVCKCTHLFGDMLKSAFAAIPQRVTTLDLSSCDLGNKTSADLVSAFATIPQKVTTLHLLSNSLSHKTGEDLATLFVAIPQTGGVI